MASVSNGSTVGSITHLGERIYQKVHTLHKVRDLTTIFKAFDGEHHTPWEGNETSNHKISNIWNLYYWGIFDISSKCCWGMLEHCIAVPVSLLEWCWDWWSRQRANDRYKDHLDGQLTRGLLTLSLWGPHIRWLEEPRACNQFLGSGSGVTYKQASDHSILPLVSKCWQYCVCKRKRNTFKIKTLIGPKFMSVVSLGNSQVQIFILYLHHLFSHLCWGWGRDISTWSWLSQYNDADYICKYVCWKAMMMVMTMMMVTKNILTCTGLGSREGRL